MNPGEARKREARSSCDNLHLLGAKSETTSSDLLNKRRRKWFVGGVERKTSSDFPFPSPWGKGEAKTFSFALIFIISNALANNEMNFCIIHESIQSQADWEGRLREMVERERNPNSLSVGVFLISRLHEENVAQHPLSFRRARVAFYGTFGIVTFSADSTFVELLLFLCC